MNKKEKFIPKIETESAEELAQQEGYELGIDEAGRGPVMGPLVYGAAWWKINKRTEIQTEYKFTGKRAGDLDSKKVAEKKREAQFEAIQKDPRIQYKVLPIHPETISEEMLALHVVSLNVISKTRAKALVQHALDTNIHLARVQSHYHS